MNKNLCIKKFRIKSNNENPSDEKRPIIKITTVICCNSRRSKNLMLLHSNFKFSSIFVIIADFN